MAKFSVGFGKVDITPPLDTLLYGYPRERRAQKVLDSLWLRAMAISNGNDTVLFLSGDLCAIDRHVWAQIKKDLAVKLGLKAENILFACTHTHSGPATRGSAGWGAINSEYITSVIVPACYESGKMALDSMQEAVMGVGTIDCHAAMNRRQIKDGEVILGQNPTGPYDPTMTVITFKNPSGNTIASFVHYACHPTVAGANLSVTRDWPGYVVDRLEEITGSPCIYFNGAEGDVGPRLSNGRTTATEPYIAQIGLTAADDAQRAYESITEFKAPSLKVLTGITKYPYISLPTLEEVEAELKALGDPDKLVATQISKYTQYCKIRDIHLAGEEMPDHLDVEVTAIALDDLAIVPFGFEAFCEHALNLKKKSPYKDTIFMGLTGGSFGYLPTLEQIPYGGYEVQSFHAASIPQFDDNLGNIIIDQVVEILSKLKNN